MVMNVPTIFGYFSPANSDTLLFYERKFFVIGSNSLGLLQAWKFRHVAFTHILRTSENDTKITEILKSLGYEGEFDSLQSI